jgi:hypothetical protein
MDAGGRREGVLPPAAGDCSADHGQKLGIVLAKLWKRLSKP